MNRKICFVTGTRAEYGLLTNLMKRIQDEEGFKLQLVVTGMHLSPEFGETYKQIEVDGFKIDEKLEMLLSSDTATGVVKSMGLAMIGFADAFERLQPDLIVILGDRFEMLAVAQTALVMHIPIAHISGGEITEGAIDDAIRHAITKLSSIHFSANKEYKERIIQLGEQPDRVFNVGDPGVENIRKIDYLSQYELEDYFGFDLSKLFLITFHPTTLEPNMAKSQLTELFLALDEFKDFNIIFTKSNADSDGRIINEMIDEYTAKNNTRVRSYFSLGQRRYLSTLKIAKVVIGNSSSGIVEAPVLCVPTVNIGNRQKGRLKAESIIDCDISKGKIIEAISKATNTHFIEKLKDIPLKYDGFETSSDIVKVLKKLDFSTLTRKKFYDY
ncbi:UDP-N-acetylglucosamine 2-epimerase [Lysinibacillus xylanilyticus]|uniref:UDP-N-acetylglucosamine 2-epimerase n=1 Tax=Lysinibacillus xylanilyticus TaxID=582475 RepID=UPI00083C9E79|nr:UDP-N-acetylglucosamine 2-epimerase [Lysinibacillus xylanilyticus]